MQWNNTYDAKIHYNNKCLCSTYYHVRLVTVYHRFLAVHINEANIMNSKLMGLSTHRNKVHYLYNVMIMLFRLYQQNHTQSEKKGILLEKQYIYIYMGTGDRIWMETL